MDYLFRWLQIPQGNGHFEGDIYSAPLAEWTIGALVRPGQNVTNTTVIRCERFQLVCTCSCDVNDALTEHRRDVTQQPCVLFRNQFGYLLAYKSVPIHPAGSTA